MSSTAADTRLKARYLEEVRPGLIRRFGYTSVMQAPRIEKIILNMGTGEAKQDSKALKAAQEQLATIAGQQPSVRRARKSIAAFKLREGMPVGIAVTLRGDRSYEFLDRLTSIAIPRIRDFRGLNPRSFDGRGNFSMGVREQIIFPEIDYDSIDQVRGLDITITTTAKSDAEAFALLDGLGMPFSQRGRPAGFDEHSEELAEDEGAEQPVAQAAEDLAEVESEPREQAEAEPTEEAEAEPAAEAVVEDEPVQIEADSAEEADEEPAQEADEEPAAEVPEQPESDSTLTAPDGDGEGDPDQESTS